MLAIATASLSLSVGLRGPVAKARVAAPAMNFYTVYHEFKEGKADEFWSGVADIDMGAFAKSQHESGVFNHYFMPSDYNGPIMCVWECKNKAMGSDDFQDFIDGPESPAAGLINKVYPINEMGFAPASAWPTMPAAPVKSTGSFFWVKHVFRESATEGFWANMASIDMDALAAANKEKGFTNHLFMPTTDPTTVFCVWESKVPMTAGEFTMFIDGEEGPAPGVFTNFVYPVMEGGSVPSAAFPMTWQDEVMAKIDEVLPMSLDEMVTKIKEMTKM